MSHHSTPHHSTLHHHCTTFHITLLHTNVPRHISQTVNVATHLASDHHILHLRSHYTAVCLGTTISHHHISEHNMFHITLPQSTSHTIPHPQLFHTTPTFNITARFTPHHIPHHSIFHTTTFHIALHHILILHHTTTSDTLHNFPHLISHNNHTAHCICHILHHHNFTPPHFTS